MAYYKLLNRQSKRMLNIFGNNLTSLTNHTNVVIWSDSGSGEQTWRIDSISSTSNCYIRSIIDESFGLNVYRYQGDNYYNCDVSPVSGNETDSAVRFIETTEGFFKIKLANYNYYLNEIGTANGSNVKWSILSESYSQEWRLIEVDSAQRYSIEEECHFISNSGSGNSLGVGGYYTITTPTDANIDDSFSYLNRQRWIIEKVSSGVKIKTKHGTSFYLSKGSGSNVVVTNSTTNANSLFSIIRYSAGVYEIKLLNSSLYLTASNGTLSWSSYNSANHALQLWKISEDIIGNIQNGVDVFSTNSSTSIINALVDGKEEFVGRYYTSTSSGKKLTSSEANLLHNNGLKIVSIYQDVGDENDIIVANASKHAQAALACARNVSQPEGTAIYFAVDFDAYTTSQLNAISNYFAAIKQYFTNNGANYKIGVYGNGSVCNLVKQNQGYAEYSFLASATGWAGYDSYDSTSKYNIKQGELIKYGSTDFDDNIGVGTDYGQW